MRDPIGKRALTLLMPTSLRSIAAMRYVPGNVWDFDYTAPVALEQAEIGADVLLGVYLVGRVGILDLTRG